MLASPTFVVFRQMTATVLLLLAMGGHASAQTCGDVSGDDNVLASDALLVLRKAVGQEVELTCSGQCEALETRVAQLEALLANFTVTGDSVVLTGKNLQIVSGSGSTAGEVNGFGNLIVGYNEGVGAQERSGSHNIVVGREHEYTSFGGIVAGNANTISGEEATVLGGSSNEASGDAAMVGGGGSNTASGANSAVSGGSANMASKSFATVAGGFANHASGDNAAIAGGCENTATATYSAVSGGQSNDATAFWATVSGGFNHTANGQHDWRAGALFETQ